MMHIVLKIPPSQQLENTTPDVFGTDDTLALPKTNKEGASITITVKDCFPQWKPSFQASALDYFWLWSMGASQWLCHSGMW